MQDIRGRTFGAQVTCVSEVTGQHRVRFYWLGRDGRPRYSEIARPSITLESEQAAMEAARQWARVGKENGQ